MHRTITTNAAQHRGGSRQIFTRVIRCITVLFCCVCFQAVVLAQYEDESETALIEFLDDSSKEVRRDAAYELVDRLATSEQVMLAFAKRLDDRDQQVRFRALLGLARAGKAAEPAIQELISCLGDRDDQIRYRAADALGRIGVASLEPLLAEWKDASERRRIAISRSLAILGTVAAEKFETPLVDALPDSSPELQVLASEALVAILPANERIVRLLAESQNPQVRCIALKSVAAPAAENPAEDLLIDAWKDKDPQVREAAITLTPTSRLPQKTKMELLLAALGDQEISVRIAATSALPRAGLDTDLLVDELKAKLLATDADLANASVRTLGRLGSAASRTMPELLAGVQNGKLDSQLVAQTIASVGTAAVPSLFESLEEHPDSADIVAACLGNIGAGAYDEILAELANPNPAVRAAVIGALGTIEPSNERTLSKMVTALTDESTRVRVAAVRVLASPKASVDIAGPSLIKATQDASADVRRLAISVIPRLKIADVEKSTVFRRGIEDAEMQVRVSAIRALADSPEQLVELLPELLASCSAPEASIRSAAFGALSAMSRDALTDEVSELLVAALRDQDPEIQLEATKAIASLGITEASILDALTDNLGENLDLLRESLVAIKSFGNDAGRLVPVISQLIDHPTEDIQTTSIETLFAIHADKELLAQRLTEVLSDDEWAVRTTAANTLSKLGPAAKCAVPELFGWLVRDQDENVASQCLREIDAAPIESTDLFLKHIDSGERRTSYYALFLLGRTTPASKETLRKLKEFRDTDASEWDSDDFRKKVLRQSIDTLNDRLAEDAEESALAEESE